LFLILTCGLIYPTASIVIGVINFILRLTEAICYGKIVTESDSKALLGTASMLAHLNTLALFATTITALSVWQSDIQ